MTYVYIWDFEVAPGCVPEFERIYGPEGEWVALFRKAEGYRSTRLLWDHERATRYLTIDEWDSSEAFLARFFQSRAQMILKRTGKWHAIAAGSSAPRGRRTTIRETCGARRHTWRPPIRTSSFRGRGWKKPPTCPCAWARRWSFVSTGRRGTSLFRTTSERIQLRMEARARATRGQPLVASGNRRPKSPR